MRKNVVFLFTLVLALTLFTNSDALAARGTNCPPGFMLEMHMHHEDHEREHVHVGTSADQNGDGYICMKPITPDRSMCIQIITCPKFVSFTGSPD
jgi:hypothetical protein